MRARSLVTPFESHHPLSRETSGNPSKIPLSALSTSSASAAPVKPPAFEPSPLSESHMGFPELFSISEPRNVMLSDLYSGYEPRSSETPYGVNALVWNLGGNGKKLSSKYGI